MKKTICVLSLFMLFAITGCFDITNESTINEDGSGVYNNTIDMGSMIAMLKALGGNGTKELENINKDTLISLAYMKDSVKNLSSSEKNLLDKATLRLLFNTAEEKMQLIFSFPYTQPADLQAINDALKKIRTKAIGNELGKLIPGEGMDESQMLMGDEKEQTPDLDAYFDYQNERGKISRKLNKERYALAEIDQGLKSLREMSQMSTPMTSRTIFNFPRPVKKAEGKGVKVSDDKKKVTIEATIDDFFDHPEKFEFEIEY